MKAIGLVAVLLTGSSTPAFCSGYDDLNAGIELHNSERWDDAIAAFDKALATKDLNTDQQFIAHLDRARAREAKGDIDGAVGDFSASLERRPGDSNALYERARAYMAEDRLESAHQDTDTLVSKDPDDTQAYMMRSWICEIQGDLSGQLNDLQTLIAKFPQDDSFNFDSGIANLVGGQTDKAATVFTNFLDGHNNYPYAWLWQQMTNLKQTKSVSQDIWPAFDLDKWPGPLMDFYRGRVNEAAAILAASKSDADALKGQTCEASFYIGEWHLLHGDKPAAKSLLRKAIHDCPANVVEAYTARAEIKHDF